MRREPISGRERIETTEVPSGPGAPRLLDRVRMTTRALHDSLRTEEAYVGWVRRFIRFQDKRHPQDMGAAGQREEGLEPIAPGLEWA
jgi:hypothetical protein